MIPEKRYRDMQAAAFPRVCGGDPEFETVVIDLVDFSPRVRG